MSLFFVLPDRDLRVPDLSLREVYWRSELRDRCFSDFSRALREELLIHFVRFTFCCSRDFDLFAERPGVELLLDEL